MAQNDGPNSSLVPKLIISLIAVVFAALVAALYHCIRVGWCTQYHQRRHPPQRRRRSFRFRHEEPLSSVEHSITELIPVHKFSKTNLDLEDGNDHTCTICLCEFEEGEELLTLPKCVHSFHAPCIDMWFYSHTSCPICRTDATRSPHMLMHYLDSDSERPATRQGEEPGGV